MFNKAKNLILLMIIASFLAGCAGKAVKSETAEQKTVIKKGFFSSSPSDADLLEEALASLNNAEVQSDYSMPKEKLELLLQEYPKSKLTGAAKGLIQVINSIIALQTKIKHEHVDKAKLVKENETLRAENEQLKNDIALLKKLEIQLEKRDKRLK